MKPILINTSDPKHLVKLRCFGPEYPPSFTPAIDQTICVLNAPSAKVAVETAEQSVTGTQRAMMGHDGYPELTNIVAVELLSVTPANTISSETGHFLTRYEAPSPKEQKIVYVPCSREEALDGDDVYTSDGKNVYHWSADNEYAMKAVAGGVLIYVRPVCGIDLPLTTQPPETKVYLPAPELTQHFGQQQQVDRDDLPPGDGDAPKSEVYLGSSEDEVWF